MYVSHITHEHLGYIMQDSKHIILHDIQPNPQALELWRVATYRFTMNIFNLYMYEG